MHPPSRHLTASFVVLLFTFSFAIKVAGLVYMNRYLSWNLEAPDTRGTYKPIALSLTRGEGYALDGDHRDATRIAPGFPIYLALVYGVTGPDAPIWLLGTLNALMRAMVSVLVGVLGARAFGARAGLAAGVLHALDPWEAFWGAFVLKESLAVLLLVVAVWSILRSLEAPSWRRGISAGALIAVAGLTRYASLGLYPWLVALPAFGARPGRGTAVRLTLSISVGFLLALSPWLIRNYTLFHEPLVSTLFAGRYFYVSNAPGLERTPETWGYSGQTTPAARPLEEAARHSTRAGGEWALVGETARHLVVHPRTTAILVGARLINMWRPTFRGSSLTNVMVLGISYCGFMALAIVGLVDAWRRRERRITPDMQSRRDDHLARSLVYWTLGFFLLLHVLFWSEIRYRQYVTPFVAVLAGLGCHAILQRWLPQPIRPLPDPLKTRPPL